MSPKRKKENKFICAYCEDAFVKESTLATHLCKIKERDGLKDTKVSRMAMQIYFKFYEKNFSKRQRRRTWEDFIKSSTYSDFMKVSKYVLDLNAINLPQFIEFLVASQQPITKWTSSLLYERYIRELTKNETPDAAVRRNILLMEQWAANTDNHWTEFFEKISPAQATLWIQTGRISPWILYISEKSHLLFNRMSDEQLNLVSKYIDPDYWALKMKHNTEDVVFLREIFDEAGI